MRLRHVLASALLVTIGLAGCAQTTVEGPGDKKLTLLRPADQQMQRGETNQVMIVINRENFRDGVKVRFDDLPAGVRVQDKDAEIAAGQTTATFTLAADAKATLVNNHKVTVTAAGPNGMKAVENFQLTIKDKSGSSESR